MDSSSDGDCRGFCERWLAAWTGNNPEGLLEFFCEDVLYRDPARASGIRGREDLLSYLQIQLARNPQWRLSLVDFWKVKDDFIVLKLRYRLPVGDKYIDELGVALLEMKDGLIWSCEMYLDRSDWLRALRLEYTQD